MALQRYKSQIVSCLSHQDPSIRRRGLDVISALIDENNAESLIPEIIVYLKLADSEFRAELVSKIYTAVQKFGRTPQWQFDTIYQIFVDSGTYTTMEIVSSFCELIAATPALHEYAAQRLSQALLDFSDNQTLVQVAAFVVGEFASAERGAIDALASVVGLPQTVAETQMYAVTALAKMGTRFGRAARVLEVLAGLTRSNNLEVQQRAGEMGKLLTHADVADEMLAPMEERAPDAAAAPRIVVEPAAQADSVLDSLLLELDEPVPPPPATPPPRQPPATPPRQSPAPQPAPAPQRPQQAGVELARLAEFVVLGRAMGNPQDKRQIALNVLVYGTGQSQFTEFRMEFRIVPGWTLHPQPPDRSVLAPAGGPPVSQVVYLTNLNNGPFQMHVRFAYRFGAQPLSEAATVTTLPPIA
jgi:hypothetical protein